MQGKPQMSGGGAFRECGMEAALPPLADVLSDFDRFSGARRRGPETLATSTIRPAQGVAPRFAGAVLTHASRQNEGAEEEVVTRQPGHGTVGNGVVFRHEGGPSRHAFWDDG